MAKDDLKKLGRAELLQLLLEVEEENERLQQQVDELKSQLEDRRIRVEKCGNLAEASLELNGIFAAAQAACEQYVENIQDHSAHLEEHCRRMERETEERCRTQEKQTAAKCEKMLADAMRKCDTYWRVINEKVDRRMGRQDDEVFAEDTLTD
jgi:cell division septum initiation protein DivIVA